MAACQRDFLPEISTITSLEQSHFSSSSSHPKPPLSFVWETTSHLFVKPLPNWLSDPSFPTLSIHSHKKLLISLSNSHSTWDWEKRKMVGKLHIGQKLIYPHLWRKLFSALQTLSLLSSPPNSKSSNPKDPPLSIMVYESQLMNTLLCFFSSPEKIQKDSVTIDKLLQFSSAPVKDKDCIIRKLQMRNVHAFNQLHLHCSFHNSWSTTNVN